MRGISKLTVARYVRACLRHEDVPRVSELAAAHGLTPEYVSRSFRERFGLRISDYMKAMQVRAARHLLRTTDLNTTRIAYRCGFGTRRSFFRTYRRFAGTSPAEDSRPHVIPNVNEGSGRVGRLARSARPTRPGSSLRSG